MLREYLKGIMGETGKPASPKTNAESDAALAAKKMHLVSLGYGNWGPTVGKPATHTTKDGKLVPVGVAHPANEPSNNKKEPTTPVQTKPIAPVQDAPEKDASIEDEEDSSDIISSDQFTPDDNASADEVISKLSIGSSGAVLSIQGDGSPYQQQIDNGFTKDTEWSSAGNASGLFNENGTNEAQVILDRAARGKLGKQKLLSAQALANILFREMHGTKLGKQLTASVPGMIDFPSYVPNTTDDKNLYKNCIRAALAALSKYNYITNECLKDHTEDTHQVVFGGSASDKSAAIQRISGIPGKIYVFHEETQQLTEINKEVVAQWVKIGGRQGGNATDTITLTYFPDGNMLYSGWYDKRESSATIANSSVIATMTNKNRLLSVILQKHPHNEESINKALAIITKSRQEFLKTEGLYMVAAATRTNHLREIIDNVDITDREELLSMMFKKLNNEPGNSAASKKEKNIKDKFNKFVTSVNEVYASNITELTHATEQQRLLVNKLQKKYDIMPTPELKMKLEKQKFVLALREYKEKFAILTKEVLDNPIPSDKRLKYIKLMTLMKNKPDEAKRLYSTKDGFVGEEEAKILSRILDRIGNELTANGKPFAVNDEYNASISKARDMAGKVESSLHAELHNIPITIPSYNDPNTLVTINLDDYIAAEELETDLHLEIMDDVARGKDGNYDPIDLLKHSTIGSMGGVILTAKTLRHCLKVKNTDHFKQSLRTLHREESNTFAVGSTTQVTGKRIRIFYLDEVDNKPVYIASKVFRPKDGPEAPTETTTKWTPNMQKCFKGQSPS